LIFLEVRHLAVLHVEEFDLKTLLRTPLALGLLSLTAGCGLPGAGNAPPPQSRHFTIRVTGSKADVTALKAYEGDTLTITVFADKSQEIHLHGYDLHFNPTPEKAAETTFKADKTGSFEYEIEESSTHLGNLEVDPR